MDSTELGDILLGYRTEKRDKWFELLKNPVFKPIFNYPSWEETREHPYRKLKAITDSKVMSVTDFGTEPNNIFMAHEFLAMADPSAAIKFTVQFNLFGGSVFALSTDRHFHMFSKIDDLSVCGCFCLTELGYGNNAVKMETTATYDKAT
jgi:acyl-CoA oxidase